MTHTFLWSTLMLAIALVGSNPQNAAAAQDAPTFTKDVASILFSKCAVCHKPGEPTPMSLLTYETARPWAR